MLDIGEYAIAAIKIATLQKCAHSLVIHWLIFINNGLCILILSHNKCVKNRTEWAYEDIQVDNWTLETC